MSPQEERRYALVIATANYRDPKLRQLRAPAADARGLAEVLGDPRKGDFGVEVLVDETQSTVTRRIARFFRDRRPQDLLLVHLSCHGVKDDHGELYLAASDTEVDLLSATGVSAAWLNEQITRSRSKRTLVLLDCCFSGSFPFGMRARGGDGVDAPEQLQGRGRVIITASSALEYAYEGDDLRGAGKPSIFTEAVIEALRSGEADADGDGWVSVDELYDYVYSRVRDRTPSQTPNMKSDLEGPLYVVRSSGFPPVEPAAIDPDLLARSDDRDAGVRAAAAEELAEMLRSSDPAVALAARQRLSRLISDDRQHAAPSSPAPTTPPATAPPAQPPAPPVTPASTEGPKGPMTWIRQHTRLVLGSAAVAVIALIALGAMADDEPRDQPAPTEPAAVTRPAGVLERCTDAGLTAEAKDVGAQRQWQCGEELGFLQYASPGEARTALPEIRGELKRNVLEGARSCDDKMPRDYAGETFCLRSQSTGDIAILWHGDGTSVMGAGTAEQGTTVEDAVDAWHGVTLEQAAEAG